MLQKVTKGAGWAVYALIGAVGFGVFGDVAMAQVVAPTIPETAGAVTDELYVAIPILLGILATVAIVFWVARRLLRVAGGSKSL